MLQTSLLRMSLLYKHKYETYTHNNHSLSSFHIENLPSQTM
jgi:hypothetical protein